MASWTTRLALGLYAVAARLHVTETRLGRALFPSAYAFYKRSIEARYAPRLLAYIPQGTTVIDVGANVGFFTQLFAAHLQRGQVIAIEPEAHNADALRTALHRQGLHERVTIHQALAADSIGERLLEIDPLHPANHHIGTQGIPTPSLTLDSLAEAGAPISLIKIDVQGAEMLVLRGAQAILERDHPVLYVEVSDADLSHFDESAESLLAWIEAHGYTLHMLGPQTSPPLPRADILRQIQAHGYGDVLCLPAS